MIVALVLVGILWLPYAGVLYWRLRNDQQLKRTEMADARSWVNGVPFPLMRALAPVLLVTLPVMWEATCVFNGLMWPVIVLADALRRRKV